MWQPPTTNMCVTLALTQLHVTFIHTVSSSSKYPHTHFLDCDNNQAQTHVRYQHSHNHLSINSYFYIYIITYLHTVCVLTSWSEQALAVSASDFSWATVESNSCFSEVSASAERCQASKTTKGYKQKWPKHFLAKHLSGFIFTCCIFSDITFELKHWFSIKSLPLD